MLGITIFCLMGMAGLVLDYSRAVWARAQMQKGADSAALAGARYLPSNTDATTKSGIMLNQNYPYYKVDGTGRSTAALTPGTNQFEVTVWDDVPTNFMSLFGHTEIPVSVYARAITGVNTCGLRGGSFPFCLINPNTNADPTDDLGPDAVPLNYWDRYILAYRDPNINVPDWANGAPPNWTPSDLGPAKGWRSAIGLNDDGTYDPGTGRSDIVYAIVYGWIGTMRVDDLVPTILGVMGEPIARARDDRLAQSTLTLAAYQAAIVAGNEEIYRHDPRIVIMPVVSLLLKEDPLIRYTVEDFYNGIAWDHATVIIDGFAPFWLLSEDEQGDVDGDGRLNDSYFFTGLYLPPIVIDDEIPCESGEGQFDFGVYAIPRLDK